MLAGLTSADLTLAGLTSADLTLAGLTLAGLPSAAWPPQPICGNYC
jgi:hypothetical protein